MKTLQTIAIFTIFLVIMLPVIQAQELTPQQPSSPQQALFSITANTPRYSRANVIDISGTTSANATIELFIKKISRRKTVANADGTFFINSVHLPDTDNDVLLRATDSTNNTVEQSATITVDTEVPAVTFVNFTTLATQPAIDLKATTSKPIKVTYTVKPLRDLTPPDKVLNVRKDRVEENGISIAWDASTATDFFTYAIYRNNKRIATTTSAFYTDSQIASNTNYEYRVSSVDKTCNEGQHSEPIIITSLAGKKTAPELSDIKLGCEPEQKTLQIDHSGTFVIPLQLQEGTNNVDITARDLAGHTINYKNTTTLDTVPPQIFDSNLAQLSPSYIPDITIKGTLNKKATVFAYINENKKPTAYTVSNDDGTFSLPLQLRRDIKTTTNSPRKVSLETGEGWDNTIKLEAVDAAGRTSPATTGSVKYALCGFGSWFSVDIGKPLPEKITPRFLLQGIQEIGLTFNATYHGNYNVTVGQITVNPLTLSPELEDAYDNGLADVNALTQAQNPKSILGYLQVMFRPFTFPTDTTMTTYDKEKNISLHRASTGPNGNAGTEKIGPASIPYISSQYKNCLTPGIGCMKLFLEVDIPFQEKIPKQIIDPTTQKTVYKFDLQNHVQKTCMPIEMTMDIPVPPKLIPKNFLKAAIELLDRAVDAMDVVLNPLTTIGTYVLYACFASTAWFYIDTVKETWNCDVQSWASKIGQVFSPISGGEDQGHQAFTKEEAAAGLCDVIHTDKNSDDNKRCNACQKSIESSQKFQYEYLQPICDRVACPSAPTLQTHIRTAGELEPVIKPDQLGTITDPEIKKWAVGDTIYSGDDCAFGPAPYQTNKDLQKIALTYESSGSEFGIKDIFNTVKNKKGKLSDGKITAANCAEYARPAHPDCCGASYMREWGGACGVPQIYDTFDELEQSTCLAAQNVNQKLQANKDGLHCGGVLNAVAGFCDPETGGEVIDPIPTRGIRYEDKPEGTALSDDVYVLVIPKQMFARKSKSSTTKDYQVYRGYVATRYTKGQAASDRKTFTRGGGGRFEFEVGAKTVEVSDGTDLTKFFNQENKEGKDLRQDINYFKEQLCSDTNGKIKSGTCSQQKAQEVYNQIYEHIGVSDKEYIVKPDQEGMLRSFQCVCLPALTSYLQFWRNLLGAVRDCMKSILLTGDGSEGVCKATLSTYVCDLLFDIVKCFVQKFSTPGYGTRARGGIGDFIGTLTTAGSEVQRKVQGRYGESALWKTMFVDKKLIHSLCAFAFTGKWNLDVSTIFSQTVQTIPVQSQGFLTPCTRQFVSFSPTTEPKGRTTWVYHFGVGVAAGADVRPELILKCSQGFQCNPADGFKNGECDCNKKGEITRTILTPEIPPTVKKNDILNKEIFYTIQADNPDSAIRYDKAILRYTYIDPKSNKEIADQTPCDIRLTGSDAPNFCQFDPFSLSFRCQFGVGQSAVRLESATPKYTKYKNNVLTFGINDPINVDLQIRQQLPVDKGRSFEGTKYITYTLKNQQNKIIHQVTEKDPSSFPNELKQDGEYTRLIELTQGTQIKQDDFTLGIAPTAITTTPIQQSILTGPFLPINKPQDTTILTSFSSSKKQQPYILKYDTNGFALYEAASGAQQTNGEFNKRQPAVQSNLVIIPNQPVSPNTPNILPNGAFGDPTTISFTLKELPPPDSEILILPQQPVANPCLGEDAVKQPVQWPATIEIHDADKNGIPSSQVSIDPATSKEARQDITINAICQDTNTLIPFTQVPPTLTTSPSATTPTAPAPTATLSTNVLSVVAVLNVNPILPDAIKNEVGVTLVTASDTNAYYINDGRAWDTTNGKVVGTYTKSTDTITLTLTTSTPPPTTPTAPAASAVPAPVTSSASTPPRSSGGRVQPAK